MCSHIIKDKIHNNYIRKWVGVTSITEKLVENRLRWFENIQRRPIYALVKRVNQRTWSTIKRRKKEQDKYSVNL